MKGRRFMLGSFVAIFFCIASLLANHAMAADNCVPNSAAVTASESQIP